MTTNTSEIFLSYAWGDDKELGDSRETIVDELFFALTEYGFNVVRDKKDLNYKDSIKQFEERIGKGNHIIIVISDKYLKSEHCMFELLKIIENKGRLKERIYPVVLPDAGIYDELDRIDYINYWDEKIENLNAKIKTIKNPVGITSVIQKINQYNDIRRIFGEITETLRDMNTLTPELIKNNNFAFMIETLSKNMSNKELDAKSFKDIPPDEWN